jgi:hypothetical protein
MRTIPRRADVWLDPKHARCEPIATLCDRKLTCARYLANINGAPLEDYSRGPYFSTPYWLLVCNDWLPIERPPASAPTPTRVHPPIS